MTPKSSFLLQNTGKSPAIQHAAQDPLDFIQLLDTVITKTTSSGLVKHLAQHKKGIILSPEVFDILNKLMKSDGDNATVSYRAFKHGKRSSRSIAETEYQRATESLQDVGFGRIVEFRVPRARSACKVFIKSKPEPYPTSAPLSSTEFDSLVAMPIHKDIF